MQFKCCRPSFLSFTAVVNFVSMVSRLVEIESESTMKLEAFRHLLSLVLQKTHTFFFADVL